MKKTYSIIFLSCGILLGGCANMWVKKGNKRFDAEAYSEAVTYYQKAIDKKQVPEAKVKLAQTYLKLNNSKKAEELFREAVTLPESEPINQFYFGKVLMQNRKYEEAGKAFREYAKSVPDDKLTQNMIAACDNWRKFEEGLDTCAYTFKKIETKGFASAYGASPFNFGFVFATESVAETKKATDKYTGQTYLDLYYFKKDPKAGSWSTPVWLTGGVNSEYHDAFATFTADGKTMYFTRSNEAKGKAKKNAKNEITLKILKASLIDNEWTNIEEFAYNNDDFSNAHPALSRDGKYLYFSSDRPGGFGATDLYVCTWDGSKWGEPVNLGATVNTAAREGYPWLSADNTLYFASEGHPGLGGLDVFKSKGSGNSWSAPENMKAPVNSSRDDFSYSIDDDGKFVNVSSSRNGNDNDLKGNDQMYEIFYKDPIVKTTVCVFKSDSVSRFAGAMVRVQNDATAEADSALTDSQGNVTFWLKGEADYTIRASSKKFFTNSINVSTKGKYCKDAIVTCDEGKKIYLDEADTTGTKEYNIGDIFYDFNKWDIRKDAEPNLDKLVKLLRDNPSFTVEMGSHTDCRGTDEYNQRLSENRAKAVVKYCTNRDIKAKRLRYKGYGESDPREKCVCEQCTDEQHQANRRTVFKVITDKPAAPAATPEKKK
ncbi:MAG: OmpA family protein [Bacteroidia bacterium]|nr:OmpA family protein [Bacteroidia bacterium]